MKTLVFCLLVLLVDLSEQVDLTLQPGAAGSHVVEAVLTRIQEKCVFEDDKLFLRRLAYVETLDGTLSTNAGGIWKVDPSKFLLTKNVNNAILSAVQTEYGINWASATWADLQKPLYSGLAARLFLQYKKQTAQVDIPSSLSNQADYWVNHYNPSGIKNDFISLSNQITKICDVVADVAFMVDGSGSVGSSNFEKVKKFVKEVTANLNVGPDPVTNSRVAVTVFQSSLNRKFDFNDHSSLSSYTNAIDNIAYPRGGTNTHSALNDLTSNTFLVSKGARSSSIPKIAIVVTDGKSSNKVATINAAANLIASGVRVFAVGVGSNLDLQELKAIASDPDCTHLSVLANFQEFDAFVNQIEKKVCDVDTPINNNTDTTIKVNGTKYYTYNITASCDVLEISSTYGEANVYYAFSYQPNRARYDGFVEVTPTTPRFLYTSLSAGIVYITAEAMSDVHLTFEFLNLNCQCPGCLVPVSLGPNFHQCIEVDSKSTTTTRTTTRTTTTTTTARVSTTTKNIEEGPGYNCGDNNPCFPTVIIPYKFYYTHTNPNKYVQCSEWGQCYVMDCPSGLQWNDPIHTCDY